MARALPSIGCFGLYPDLVAGGGHAGHAGVGAGASVSAPAAAPPAAPHTAHITHVVAHQPVQVPVATTGDRTPHGDPDTLPPSVLPSSSVHNFQEMPLFRGPTGPGGGSGGGGGTGFAPPSETLPGPFSTSPMFSGAGGGTSGASKAPEASAAVTTVLPQLVQMLQDTQAMVADLTIAVASLREEVARGAAVSFPLPPWTGAQADGSLLPPFPVFPEFPGVTATTVGRVGDGASVGAEESKVTDGGIVITTPDVPAPPPSTPEAEVEAQTEASAEPAAPALAPTHGRRADRKHHGHGHGTATPRQLQPQAQPHSPVVTAPSGPLVDADGFEIRELPVTVPAGVRLATKETIAELCALGVAPLARRSVADLTSALAYFGHTYKPPKDSAAQLLYDLLHGADVTGGRDAQPPLLPPASPVLTPVAPVE